MKRRRVSWFLVEEDTPLRSNIAAFIYTCLVDTCELLTWSSILNPFAFSGGDIRGSSNAWSHDDLDDEVITRPSTGL